MTILWSEKLLHNKELFYITDTAPYKVKSGHALKVKFV